MPTDQTPVAAADPNQFFDTSPDRLIAKGHPAGDFIEAYRWTVTDERPGYLRVDAHLPDQVRNPKGQLFGGFTGTYVDMISLFAYRAGPNRTDPDIPKQWLTTINMRIDYYEPVVGPRFVIEAAVEHRRGRTGLVTTRMYQDEALAVFALTTIRSIDEP